MAANALLISRPETMITITGYGKQIILNWFLVKHCSKGTQETNCVAAILGNRYSDRGDHFRDELKRRCNRSGS